MAEEQETLTSTKKEGTQSDFGERLDYSKPKCQDAWAGILFYLHVAGVIGGAIYVWGEPKYWSQSQLDNSFSYKGVYITVAASIGIGTGIGLIWLFSMIKCAKTIMRIMLLFNIVLWVVNLIIGISLGWKYAWPYIIMCVIGLLCSALFTAMIWNRLDFSAALLTISTRITVKYNGSIFLSLIIIGIDIGWYFVWGNCAIGWMWYAQNNNNGIEDFLLFLLLVSFYWGNEVWKNVVHTTACGIAATWYFEENAKKPFCPAFKRTMITSFGSICLGALIVAVISALREMVQQARYRARSEGGNPFCLCILECMIVCLENLIRYFNTYAFAHVAIYGTSYIESAKNAKNLFESNKGWIAIINDSLVGGTINMGSLVAMIISMIAGYFIGDSYHDSTDDYYNWYANSCAIIGGIIGFMLCVHILQVIASMVVSIFVCFAEEPQAMVEMHPKEFEQLTGLKVEWKYIADGVQPPDTEGQGQEQAGDA